jgi:TM2 domain-containing membrane protein YozV
MGSDLARQSEQPDRVIIVQSGKSSGLAAVLSFFIPGLGQLYNGQFLKGFLMFVLFGISAAAIMLLIGIVTTPILWLVGIIDAYRTADSLNQKAERQYRG